MNLHEAPTDNRLTPRPQLLCANLLWITIFVAGLALLYIGMPKTGDDYQFAAFLKPWYDAQGILYPEDGGDVFGHGMPWDAVARTWADRFATNNIRIGTVLAPLLLVFPKWVGGSLTLLCSIAMVFVTLRLAGTNWRHSALVPVCLACLALLNVCGDYMGELDFQLNYLPPTMLAGVVLLWIGRGGRFGPWLTVAVFLLALLTGAWHEGIAVPVGGGLLFLALTRPDTRTPALWTAVAGLTVGVALLCLSPGMRNRVNGGGTTGNIDMIHLRFAVTSVLLWLFSTWLFFRLAARLGFARLCGDTLAVFCMASALLSFSIMQRSGVYMRGGWWGVYASGLCLLRMLQLCRPAFWSRYTHRNLLVVTPLLLLTYAHQGAVGYWALRYRAEMRRQAEAWVAAPCSMRFWDMPFYGRLPLICLGQPIGEPDNLLFSSVSYWYGTTDPVTGRPLPPRGYDCMREPVPLTLAEVTASSGVEVPGGSGVRRLGDCLFMTEDGRLGDDLRRRDRSVTILEAVADLGRGPEMTRFVQVSFISRADGHRYSWLQPVTRLPGNAAARVRCLTPPLRFVSDK